LSKYLGKAKSFYKKTKTKAKNILENKMRDEKSNILKNQNNKCKSFIVLCKK
jgi:hypothetical protein